MMFWKGKQIEDHEQRIAALELRVKQIECGVNGATSAVSKSVLELRIERIECGQRGHRYELVERFGSCIGVGLKKKCSVCGYDHYVELTNLTSKERAALIELGILRTNDFAQPAKKRK